MSSVSFWSCDLGCSGVLHSTTADPFCQWPLNCTTPPTSVKGTGGGWGGSSLSFCVGSVPVSLFCGSFL